MKAVWIIAKNTYREIIRDRILYGLIVFSLIIVGASLALGQLSFSEQARISANFGMAAIHLCAIMLAIFVGSTLVYKEIEKQTILTLLVRPLNRMQFLLGKSIGLILIIASIIMGLAVVQIFIFWGLGVPVTENFFITMFGILIEAFVLMGFALFLSTLTSPVLVVSFSLGLFLIGHWIENLNFLAQKSSSTMFVAFAKLSTYSLPNLERFNWRESVIYGTKISMEEILLTAAYGLGWWLLLLVITSAIFRKKDFA